MNKITIVLLIGCQVLIGADFSIKNVLKDSYKNSVYFAKVESASYVVLKDVNKIPNLGEGCDYFEYVETYNVIETYKGSLPKYITVKKTGEYCGKFKLKQFSENKKGKISLIGLQKKKDFFYIRDAFDEIPDINETKKDIKEFISSLLK